MLRRITRFEGKRVVSAADMQAACDDGEDGRYWTSAHTIQLARNTPVAGRARPSEPSRGRSIRPLWY